MKLLFICACQNSSNIGGFLMSQVLNLEAKLESEMYEIDKSSQKLTLFYVFKIQLQHQDLTLLQITKYRLACPFSFIIVCIH